MWNLEKIVQMNYLQGRNRDTDVKNRGVDMEDEVGEGGQRGVMNWETAIDIRTEWRGEYLQGQRCAGRSLNPVQVGSGSFIPN